MFGITLSYLNPYCLNVFEHKIGSHINIHGLFYINTHPPPTSVVLSFLKTLYPGIRISSFFMYSCNKVSLTQKCQNCFIYNTTNFINFRIKTSGIQMTNICFVIDMMRYIFWLHMIQVPIRTIYLDLSGRRVNAVVSIDFSFNCIVCVYSKYDYYSI